jgi:UDP-N-acetylglucosamine:LPS N-acetylglucosamine transferase
MKDDSIPVTIVLTLGGHTFEALALVDQLKSHIYPSYLICDDNFLAQAKIRVPGPAGVFKKCFALTKGLKPYQFYKESILFILAFFQSLYYLLKFKSRALVATGSGSSFAPIVAAKLLGKKVIFVESACRVTSRSFCGDIVYKYFADQFFIQWPEQLKAYPRAQYFGRPF